jgi:hypothetical protein
VFRNQMCTYQNIALHIMSKHRILDDVWLAITSWSEQRETLIVLVRYIAAITQPSPIQALRAQKQ